MTATIDGQAYIDGAWCEARSGARFAIIDPANGETIGSAPDMDGDDALAAIAAAAAALPGWRARTAHQRSDLLRQWAGLILDHEHELADLLLREQGKTIDQARGEVGYGASFVQWYAEEALRIGGEVIGAHPFGLRMWVSREPVGVCAAITPWNYPLAMVTRKIAPALAAGCTVVLKPAEDTPLTALALARLADQVGIPAGVLNIVTAHDPEAVGTVLSTDPRIRHLSFTGSVETGRLLLRNAAATVKKCTMELGGNAPFLLFDDADIDGALDALMASKFRNAGQTCVCPNRVLVPESIHDAIADAIVARVRLLKTGHGAAPDTDIGPLINIAAVENVERHVADALGEGAQLLCGGERTGNRGAFYTPTVLANVTPAMRIAREEVFGPVVSLIGFANEDEAIAMANDTEFGLAAYLFTRDVDRMARCAGALEYGIVGINESAVSNVVAPFGGVKQSGIGREGASVGIAEYLESKYHCLGLGALAA